VPPPTKPAEFQVKNSTKAEHLLFVTFVIFQRKKIRLALEMHIDKAVSVGRSNSASLQPPEAKGGSGAEHSTLRRNYSFFPKKKMHF